MKKYWMDWVMKVILCIVSQFDFHFGSFGGHFGPFPWHFCKPTLYLKTMHGLAVREGLVSKWVDLNELRKTLPYVSKNCLGATFSNLSDQVVPGVLAEAIASACRANGVVVIEGEEVVRVETRGVLGLFDGYRYKTVTKENSYRSSFRINWPKLGFSLQKFPKSFPNNAAEWTALSPRRAVFP